MAGELFLFPIPDAWEQITLGEIVRRGDGTIQTGPFGSNYMLRTISQPEFLL
jgi:hypothetical protein